MTTVAQNPYGTYLGQGLEELPLMELLEAFRQASRAGKGRREWDPKSEFYQVNLSNKQLKIAARLLSGQDELDMDEAWDIVWCAAFGQAR